MVEFMKIDIKKYDLKNKTISNKEYKRQLRKLMNENENIKKDKKPNDK